MGDEPKNGDKQRQETPRANQDDAATPAAKTEGIKPDKRTPQGSAGERTPKAFRIPVRRIKEIRNIK